MGVKQVMRRTLDLLGDRRYFNTLEEKRGNYEAWLELQNTETPEELFRGRPELLMAYGDEDVAGPEGKRSNPWFRPDWSPELLESCFYVGSVIAVRRSFLEEAMPQWRERMGAFCVRPNADSPEEWNAGDGPAVFVNETPDPAYRRAMAELFYKAGGWEKGCVSIGHSASIWHHCSALEGLEEFAKHRDFEPFEPAAARGELPKLLSVVIPSKDNPLLLEKCLQALDRAAEGIAYEVIVVDNGSSAENRTKIDGLLREKNNASYLYRPMEFHFSKMCNLGAAAAEGELLLFINDDVELLRESSLLRMAELADKSGVGSVGLKLYYPNTVKIQHAGITNLPMGPVHKLQFCEDDREYYFGMNRGCRNVLANSAACVMLRKKCFLEAGGFEETLRVAFNDVALGFRLHRLGYRNVCLCDGFAYHHESLTRGDDEAPEKLSRLLDEREKLYGLFPELEGTDPYYSVHLGRQGLDTRVRPAYETMYNTCQEGRGRSVNLQGSREDACLMFRVEDERDGEITGYAVVLGDDNACYRHTLLLQGDDGRIVGYPLEGQYRPDLSENLPEQCHVALSGFRVKVPGEELTPGRYRLGDLAKREFSGTALVSWSNRQITLG